VAETGTIAIAIDGPNGAGKSTIARCVAQTLGYAYVDTGAFYRAIGMFAVESGADPDNADEVAACLPRIDISVSYEGSRQRTIINGRDVTDDIRSQQAAEAASKVARVPSLRGKVVELARSIAKGENVVMDGRDIGTVVLPDAALKIYLDASLEIRAFRRVWELEQAGRPAEYATVLYEISRRDHRDKTREASPLRIAEGAVVIDSSRMNAEQVCARIVEELAAVTGRG